jgi:hypothetical protein
MKEKKKHVKQVDFLTSFILGDSVPVFYYISICIFPVIAGLRMGSRSPDMEFSNEYIE